MPAIAAVGTAVVSAIGATGAAATVIATAVTSAIVGAGIGFAKAIITGEDPLKGALMGAGMGAVTGGLLGGVSAAVAPVADTSLSVAANQSLAQQAPLNAASNAAGLNAAANQSLTQQLSNATPSGGLLGSVTRQAVTPPPTQGSGLLSGITKNPNFGEIAGRTLAGGAEAMINDKTKSHELDVLIEQNRLNRDAQKIKGLTNIKSPILPSINTFSNKPAWMLS